jgi:NADH-quinone oxidoreductase subunit L
MQANAGLIGTGAATAAGLLLFMGATGKSAQIPLYVWLPDAMVGPTPVSALIHAATMVTAGVYMIARLNFLYMLAPDAMAVVATIGGLTAFFAATIAIVQPDIKRVLAYSTISQLGYMFLGVGSGAFAAGIFHLMTHAFFKGLLFLCAGSVIHALEGEQDMNKMGALRTRVPITFWTMLIATLAICAVPGFSGYFSKDLILEGAYASGHFWLWLLGAITAGITCFYMFRLLFMTFFGESRVEPGKLPHLHESPPIMTIPLVVLAVFATIGGWVGLPDGLLWGDAFAKFLSPVVGDFKPAVPASPAMLSAVATGLGGIGILLAYVCYLRLPGVPQLVAARLSGLYHLLLEKYRIDELYDLLVTRPLFFISDQILDRGIYQLVIDGTANRTGLAVESGGEAARRVEDGNVQHYAFVYLLGVIGIVAYYLYLVIR